MVVCGLGCVVTLLIWLDYCLHGLGFVFISCNGCTSLVFCIYCVGGFGYWLLLAHACVSWFDWLVFLDSLVVGCRLWCGCLISVC